MNQGVYHDLLVRVIGKFFRENFNYDKATLFFTDKVHPEKIRIHWTDGIQDEIKEGVVFPLGVCQFSQVLKEKNLVVISGSNTKAKKRINIPEMKSRAMFEYFVGVAFRTADHVYGGLVFEYKNPTDQDSQTLEKLKILSELIGTAIERTEQYEILLDRSVRDGLTRLYNRSAFDDAIVREIARSKRYETRMALLMGDIDKFKRINDTHGHLAGDYVLKKISRIFLANVRKIDFVARYGGDEFAILIINATKEFAMITGERLRKTIDEGLFQNNDDNIHVQISIGVAEYPADGKSPEEIISASDEALYKAKKVGGNFIKHYEKGEI